MVQFVSLNYIFLLMLLAGCSHIVPAPARKMPLIKVLHKGKIENVPLERYVASVLAGEVHPSWPLEALKAQAVASRTYALKRMAERKGQDYHVQSSVMDQVYKRKTNDTFINAVRESAGIVLTVNGEYAETSFHSTCGGKTTDARSVWGRSYPHLHGGVCGYCEASPTYTWNTEVSLNDVQIKFGNTIKGIKIKSRTNDGRVDAIELTGAKRQNVTGHEFRMALSPMKVKSTMITSIKIEGSRVKISGHGFGHGVGMCQYGALGMAKSGKDFQQILDHYYPGTTVKKLY